ncbi:unnamed protein product [Prunus armeniaca]
MATLFSFRPCGMSIDILGDYKLKNRRIKTPMKATRIEIVRLRTYSGFVMTYQGMANCDHEHMMLLLFWLNKFIFPNANGGVKPEYLHLAKTLHNEVGVATCPFMLAYLYQCLHQINVCVGPSQILRPGAPGRGDVRQHVTSSFWMRCGCARACQHGIPCVEVMMRFG